jgi:RNA polymerase sigma factor (sigma-70 family)
MYKNVHSDNDFIQRYINGDENAMACLLDKHQRKIFTFILMRVKNKKLAEDIFQDTFFKIIDCFRKGKYNDEGKFLPWAQMIAHNLCMDHFRKIKRMPNIVNTEASNLFNFIGETEENREDKLVKEQTCLQLKDMINRLPDDQKEVLILRHYADLSFKEIAEITGTNINTALGRMRYALLNLRKWMSNKVVV